MAGTVAIGGDSPVSVQSMANAPASDAEAVIKQIHALEDAGCEIVRVAVPNMNAIRPLAKIRKNVGIPLVADIHYDHRLAIASIDAGVDKIRINPGNMRDTEKVREVILKAKSASIPIRVGANSGSILPRGKNDDTGHHASAEYMVDAVLDYLKVFEEENYREIVISLKSSSVVETIEAYRCFSKNSDYPLHLGITAAGTDFTGTIKSSIGIGALLSEGIGDTIRVSLTGDPVDEVRVGREILQSIGHRRFHPEIISCPTCGRCRIDLEPLVRKLEKELGGIVKPVRVSLMGCEVNGPGEAADADIGIAAGTETGVLFRKGVVIRKVPKEEFVRILVEEVRNWQEQ